MRTLSLSYIIKAVNNCKLECVRKMREMIFQVSYVSKKGEYTVNINMNRRKSKEKKKKRK